MVILLLSVTPWLNHNFRWKEALWLGHTVRAWRGRHLGRGAHSKGVTYQGAPHCIVRALIFAPWLIGLGGKGLFKVALECRVGRSGDGEGRHMPPLALSPDTQLDTSFFYRGKLNKYIEYIHYLFKLHTTEHITTNSGPIANSFLQWFAVSKHYQ